MAIEYHIRAECDKCHTEIEPLTKVRKCMVDELRWKWMDRWKEIGVMFGMANKFGRKHLYCAKCAGS